MRREADSCRRRSASLCTTCLLLYMWVLTGAEGEKGDESDGVGAQSPVEGAGVGVFNVGHVALGFAFSGVGASMW